MSASPAKLCMPAEAPAFSPSFATQPPLPLVFGAGGSGVSDDDSFRTPTGSRIAYLREATTCPPAPRKPPPPRTCKKRLFQFQAADQQPAPEAAPVALISVRLEELQRLFRPHPPPTAADKRRRALARTELGA